MNSCVLSLLVWCCYQLFSLPTNLQSCHPDSKVLHFGKAASVLFGSKLSVRVFFHFFIPFAIREENNTAKFWTFEFFTISGEESGFNFFYLMRAWRLCIYMLTVKFWHFVDTLRANFPVSAPTPSNCHWKLHLCRLRCWNHLCAARAPNWIMTYWFQNTRKHLQPESTFVFFLLLAKLGAVL